MSTIKTKIKLILFSVILAMIIQIGPISAKELENVAEYGVKSIDTKMPEPKSDEEVLKILNDIKKGVEKEKEDDKNEIKDITDEIKDLNDEQSNSKNDIKDVTDKLREEEEDKNNDLDELEISDENLNLEPVTSGSDDPMDMDGIQEILSIQPQVLGA